MTAAPLVSMRKQLEHGVEAAGSSVRSVAKSLGISTSDLAKYLGAWSVGLVKILGARRALIGTSVAGVVVGGVLVARHLRRRQQTRRDEESMKASDEAQKRPAHRREPASTRS